MSILLPVTAQMLLQIARASPHQTQADSQGSEIK
jgi:hypothetical protein